MMVHGRDNLAFSLLYTVKPPLRAPYQAASHPLFSSLVKVSNQGSKIIIVEKKGKLNFY